MEALANCKSSGLVLLGPALLLQNKPQTYAERNSTKTSLMSPSGTDLGPVANEQRGHPKPSWHTPASQPNYPSAVSTNSNGPAETGTGSGPEKHPRPPPSRRREGSVRHSGGEDLPSIWTLSTRTFGAAVCLCVWGHSFLLQALIT